MSYAPRGKQKVPNFISLKVGDELKELIGSAADEHGVPMNELIVQIVAEYFKRPDLGYVPRKSQVGRPRQPIRPRNPSSPPPAPEAAAQAQPA